MYKVVVSDLDGTLLNGQHQISPRTRDTLHRLVDQGIKFVVATGRHHVDVRSIRDTLGLDIYLITSNGAVVHDKQDQLIFNQALPDSVAAELIALERDPSIHINLYYGDEWLVEEEMPWLLQFHHESGFSYRLTDLASHPLDKVNKVFYIGEHEKLLQIEAELNQRYGDRAQRHLLPAGLPRGDARRGAQGQCRARRAGAARAGDVPGGGLWRRHERLRDAEHGRPRRGDGQCPRSGSSWR